MEQRKQIPVPSIERLCRYHRVVARARRFGPKRLSSQELATLAAVTPEQVRKDFSYFGAFGRRGVGYDVERLSVELKRILGLGKPRFFSLLGAGNLGSALAGYAGFEARGFKLAAIYDNNAARVGHMVQGLRVRSVDDLAGDNARDPVDIAILAVPEAAAQAAADLAVAAGIRALLNFAPVSLRVPEGFVLRDVDMTGELEYLSFWLAYMDENGSGG
jgi:redox-sensing transcriptional repressor